MIRRSVTSSSASILCAASAALVIAMVLSVHAAPAQVAAPAGPQAQAVAPSQDPQTIPLWTGPAPGAQGTAPEDIPTLTIYMPRNTAGPLTAVVLAPGRIPQPGDEPRGRQTANYLNSLGVATVVLKDRLGPKYQHPVELGDVQRAIRLVRARAGEWRVAPERIGVMGYSAGGHLAASASTLFEPGRADAPDPIDRVSSRPDFSILGYPVISLIEPWTHQGSKTMLLGANAQGELARALSSTARDAETPPTFLFHTNADTTVPPENSILFYMALRKAGVPAEMHIFAASTAWGSHRRPGPGAGRRCSPTGCGERAHVVSAP
jgi:acetyl esterase/lipase